MPRTSPRLPVNPSALSARSALFRAATPAVLLASLAALGCDPADADQAARTNLNNAYTYLAAGDPEQQFVALSDQAAGSNSSPATLSLANELVGDVSLDLAGATVAGPVIEGGEALPGVIGLETRALVLAEQARRLAGSMALGNTYIEAEQTKNPEPVLSAVDQQIEGIQQGESWTPSVQSGVQLPTVEQVQQRIEQLTEQLESLNGQIQQLEQQRTQLLTEASQLDQQSDQQQGQESVTTYRRVADLRTEAATAGAGIDKLNSQVRQTTAELEEAQALQAALEGAVTALEEQQTALRQSWENIQAQVGQLQQTNQQTYAGEGVSVESLSTELASTLQRLATLRQQATTLLDKASGAYEQSAGQARTAAGTRTPMFSAAFAETFSADRINLSRAVAQRRLGLVRTGEASVYAAILRLQQTLEEGGHELPAALQEALGTSPSEAYTQAVTEAAAALTQANDVLSQISGGGGRGPTGQAAITQRAVVLSALQSLHGLIETTGIQVQAELPSLQEIREQARQVIEAAGTGAVPLPQAPPFTGGDGAGPATQPATGPATEPGEEPATEPATEPAEADEEMPEEGTPTPEPGADDAPPDGI